MIAVARLMFPKASIALGCMSPQQGRAKGERLALMAGADRFVLPSAETMRLAEEKELRLIHLDVCCAVPSHLESKALRDSVDEPL